MALHWKVLVAMLAGLAAGVLLRAAAEARAWSGLTWQALPGGGLVATSAEGPAAAARLAGSEARAAILHRGLPEERRVALAQPEDFQELVASAEPGDVLWIERPGRPDVALTLALDPQSQRARWLAPLQLAADLFMKLLALLIVPLVFTSIACGVAGIGTGRELGRLGAKAFAYYISTSLLAIFVGQALVLALRPGAGAQLGLPPVRGAELAERVSIGSLIENIVPSNVFAALGDNRNMLQLIFFALLFGFFLARASEPHRERIRSLLESLLAVILRLAEGVLKLIPYGVFALLAVVVARTGLGVFRPLLLYVVTVVAALAIHALITLPVLLRFVGRISPRAWARAMAPALTTAFSTSSSNVTLPVTLETVERRGGVSNKVTSFTLPLGATINMDGTALYECIGVIFLAQYYASVDPTYSLTMGDQVLIAALALLASIGAAGIPSAGLVMMLTILAALRLPLEGAALLLAVDRPLDMLRTTVNIWSDTCGAALIARTEGELLVTGAVSRVAPDAG
jgi:proton glutamate symport protein